MRTHLLLLVAFGGCGCSSPRSETTPDDAGAGSAKDGDALAPREASLGGRDAAPTDSSADGKETADARVAEAGGVKWHPGYYLSNFGVMKAGQVGGASGQNANDFTAIESAGADVIGYLPPYEWGALETAQGVYHFTQMDADIASLTAMSPPRRYCIMINWYGDGNAFKNGQFPSYLGNDVSAYGAGANGTNSGYWTEGTGTIVALWRPGVMNRYIALLEALAAHYDANPSMDVVYLPETAAYTASNIGAGSDFTLSAMVTEYQALIEASVLAWAHTNVAAQNNYFSGQSTTDALTAFKQAHRTGQTGPDVFGAHVHKPGSQRGWTQFQEPDCGKLDVGPRSDQRQSHRLCRVPDRLLVKRVQLTLTGRDRGHDTSPLTSSGDPGISGWDYQIAPSSPIYSEAHLPALTRGWGPPGFVIPATGTPPSSPH